MNVGIFDPMRKNFFFAVFHEFFLIFFSIFSIFSKFFWCKNFSWHLILNPYIHMGIILFWSNLVQIWSQSIRRKIWKLCDRIRSCHCYYFGPSRLGSNFRLLSGLLGVGNYYGDCRGAILWFSLLHYNFASRNYRDFRCNCGWVVAVHRSHAFPTCFVFETRFPHSVLLVAWRKGPVLSVALGNSRTLPVAGW